MKHVIELDAEPSRDSPTGAPGVPPRSVLWRLIAALVGLALLHVGSAAADPGAETTAAEPAPQADQALLEEVMVEGRVATHTPRPKITQYFGDLLNGVLRQVIGWIFDSVDLDETVFKVVQWMIITLVVLLALILLYQWLRWWRRRPDPARTPKIIEIPNAPAASADWHAEVEGRLESGDAGAALEALWWWLAERLGLRDADASWTTRELVRRARRPDLMPLIRAWDRLVFSDEKVEIEGVRRLWHGLRGLVA